VDKRRLVGAVMLAVGLPLLVLQFVAAFSGPVEGSSYRDQSPSAIALHVTPYALSLLAVYFLLPRGRTPGIRNPVVHVFVTLFASWAVAGGAFMLALVMSLFVGGTPTVERLLDYTLLALVVGTAVLFPLLYPRLR
jgi:hypothetical protein